MIAKIFKKMSDFWEKDKSYFYRQLITLPLFLITLAGLIYYFKIDLITVIGISSAWIFIQIIQPILPIKPLNTKKGLIIFCVYLGQGIGIGLSLHLMDYSLLGVTFLGGLIGQILSSSLLEIKRD